MSISDENLKRDMPEIAEQLKQSAVVCGQCGKLVRRDKSVIIVHTQSEKKSILAHKSCANAIRQHFPIVIFSH